MKAVDKIKPSTVSDLVDRLNVPVQGDGAGDFGVPCGWLFRGLTFYFYRSSDRGSNASPADKESDTSQEYHLHVAANIARFAGAKISNTLDDVTVTHAIVSPEIPHPELSSLRGLLARNIGKRKLPHLVTVRWVEDSWKERTLLDEERRLSQDAFYDSALC